jgi:hypothetical protein
MFPGPWAPRDPAFLLLARAPAECLLLVTNGSEDHGNGRKLQPDAFVSIDSSSIANIDKKLLVGRIAFRQREDGVYEFSGQASLD